MLSSSDKLFAFALRLLVLSGLEEKLLINEEGDEKVSWQRVSSLVIASLSIASRYLYFTPHRIFPVIDGCASGLLSTKKEAKKVCKHRRPQKKTNETSCRRGAERKQSNIPLLNEFVISSLEQDTEECSPLACQPNGFRNAGRFALFFFGNFQTKSDAKLLEFQSQSDDGETSDIINQQTQPVTRFSNASSSFKSEYLASLCGCVLCSPAWHGRIKSDTNKWR